MEFKITTHFDSSTFKRDLERMAVDSAKKTMQPVLDRLWRDSKGKPGGQVKTRLTSEWKRASGGSITDPDLTAWATRLSEGQRIVLR